MRNLILLVTIAMTMVLSPNAFAKQAEDNIGGMIILIQGKNNTETINFPMISPKAGTTNLVIITDSMGNVVSVHTFTGDQVTISGSTLTPGVYHAVLRTGGSTNTQTFTMN